MRKSKQIISVSFFVMVYFIRTHEWFSTLFDFIFPAEMVEIFSTIRFVGGDCMHDLSCRTSELTNSKLKIDDSTGSQLDQFTTKLDSHLEN